MMASDTNSASIESLQDPSLSPKERWTAEIDMAEKELKKFHERGRMVTKRFLDERDSTKSENKWFNIFYANTNIMESALYAQLPKPAVSRRFKDYEDDTARVAALIIERCITQDLDDPRDTFDSTMRACVQDRLLPGLAAAWLRLETDTSPIPYAEAVGEPGPTPPNEVLGEGEEVPSVKTEAEYDKEPMHRITDQRICVDYVFWQDFLFSPCRIWEERRWTGRRVYMDRDQLVKRFGEKVGKVIPLDYTTVHTGSSEQGSTPKYEVLKKAVIYEIWDRGTKTVIWVSKGYPQILDTKPDPLKLVGFEPCPEPMFANITTSNCTPRPDFYMIQDQYTELDTLNNRISMLLQACKVVGVYDKATPDISRMLNEGYDNQLIPADNWAAFAEKGGVKGTIDWLPLEVVVAALTQLTQNRELVKQQIYELTGISDIVRGATKASETLGAQELKSKFASIAIKKRQDQVARFAADILRIKAEMQIKHFEPEFLIKKSNIEATGEANQQFIGPALQLLASDEGFEWRIQVTADSIAQADYAMEKADRLEFLTAASSYIEKSAQLMAQKPEATQLLVGLLKWGVAGFRNTAEIEGLLDMELDKLQKQPPQSKPDPEQQKAQMEQQKMQQQLQMDQQKHQMTLQAGQAELELKKQIAQLEMQQKQMEFQFKVKELQLEEQKARMEFDMDRANSLADQRAHLIETQMGLQASQQTHEQSLQHAEETNAIRIKAEKTKPKGNNETH
jgi:hypothetical protein